MNDVKEIQDAVVKTERETIEPTTRTTIGGQAVLEGLMMIGPERSALAVRKMNGAIHVEYMPARQFSTRATRILFVRGGVRLFKQMVIGIKALMRSADLLEEEEEEGVESDTEMPADESAPVTDTSDIQKKSEKKTDISVYLSAVAGILIGVGLFILLPNLITGLLRRSITESSGFGTTLLMNLIEGFFRISLFVGYVALASLQRDIRRVWMYHGAEHKTIACYEHGEPLTVENIKKYSARHPRCGTAFLFVVMIISILLFALTGWHAGWINILIRFALVPVVAGIAFEIIRWSGRHDNRLAHWLAAPGLAMQRLTTKEPDDEIIEVAIRAMVAVIPEQSGSDEW